MRRRVRRLRRMVKRAARQGRSLDSYAVEFEVRCVERAAMEAGFINWVIRGGDAAAAAANLGGNLRILSGQVIAGR